jgi:type III secretion protein Q
MVSPRGGRGLTITGRIEGQSFIAEGVPRMTDDTQDIDPGTDDPADALGELELPVRFEIETVSVPLSELEAIEPGYVIELAMPVADARLRLVSCGQVIGHAELVAVGDRLGARITRMVVRDDA